MNILAMYFKLSSQQEIDLLNLPETGMGYQIIEARKSGNYNQEFFLVLNSELVIEMNGYESDFVMKVMMEGIASIKASAEIISLYSISVFSKMRFQDVVTESKNENERGAIENQVVPANGEEVFARLSAFDNDRRVDKANKCLRAGSFTTTEEDYLKSKITNDDPVERYALPKNDKIQFAFYIRPKKIDTLQRGIVQPAYGKRGGGIEAYFEKGTIQGTFVKQTPY